MIGEFIENFCLFIAGMIFGSIVTEQSLKKTKEKGEGVKNELDINTAEVS